ncbi:MAG: hypothetical protein GY714_14190 [Desulfobacterales bacterium]|nr:hypothetical protein [Desulfobacterales bacterium]
MNDYQFSNVHTRQCVGRFDMMTKLFLYGDLKTMKAIYYWKRKLYRSRSTAGIKWVPMLCQIALPIQREMWIKYKLLHQKGINEKGKDLILCYQGYLEKSSMMFAFLRMIPTVMLPEITKVLIEKFYIGKDLRNLRNLLQLTFASFGFTNVRDIHWSKEDSIKFSNDVIIQHGYPYHFILTTMFNIFKVSLKHELILAENNRHVFLKNMENGFGSIPSQKSQLNVFYNKCWNFLKSHNHHTFVWKCLNVMVTETEWDEDHKRDACFAMIKFMIPSFKNSSFRD